MLIFDILKLKPTKIKLILVYLNGVGIYDSKTKFCQTNSVWFHDSLSRTTITFVIETLRNILLLEHVCNTPFINLVLIAFLNRILA